MQFITKESAFKIFYYIIASDGMIAPEEMGKLDEIGAQIFGDDYLNIRNKLIGECEANIYPITYHPEESFAIISASIEEAFQNTTDDLENGIPKRLLIWNLMLVAHSDSNFDQNERKLLCEIGRKLDINDSILFEMEQYISTVLTIEKELEELKKSNEPYNSIRPIMEELENRRVTIKNAAVALIGDEVLSSVNRLDIQDDIIDKAQAAIKEKTDPMMKKVNEQAGKVFDDVKKAAAPAAAEAGKKLGKAFMGFGAKLMGKQSPDNNEK